MVVLSGKTISIEKWLWIIKSDADLNYLQRTRCVLNVLCYTCSMWFTVWNAIDSCHANAAVDIFWWSTLNINPVCCFHPASIESLQRYCTGIWNALKPTSVGWSALKISFQLTNYAKTGAVLNIIKITWIKRNCLSQGHLLYTVKSLI